MKMDHTHHDNRQDTYGLIATYLAAASGACIQTTGMHPLDTVAKKLQNHINVKTFLSDRVNVSKKIYSILYPTPTSSLWDGYKAAITYRVVAGAATFGTQKQIQAYLSREYAPAISCITGETYQSAATHALAGAVFAPVEVLFLPLDRWKVLRQVGNMTPMLTLIQTEGRYLYTGAAVTCVRNCMAFPVMFGVSDWSKQYLSKTETATLSQCFLSACAGAVGAVVVSNPTDVIKTRMQAHTHHSSSGKPRTAMHIASDLYRTEGIAGFRRGLTPRLAAIVPRLTFIKTITDQLTPIIHDALNQGLAHSSS